MFSADMGLRTKIIYFSLVGLVVDFESKLWSLICWVMNPPICWNDVVSLGLQEWRSKTMKVYLCWLVFGSRIYNI